MAVAAQQRQLAGSDHAARLGSQPRRQHDDVGVAQHVVEGGGLGPSLLITVRIDVGVVDEEPHAEAAGDRREGPSHTAEPDQAAGATGEFWPSQIVAVQIEPPPPGRDCRAAGGDTARQRQHRAHDVFGDRLGVTAWTEEDRDTALAEALQVEVDRAAAGAADHPQTAGGGDRGA